MRVPVLAVSVALASAVGQVPVNNEPSPHGTRTRTSASSTCACPPGDGGPSPEHDIATVSMNVGTATWITAGGQAQNARPARLPTPLSPAHGQGESSHGWTTSALQYQLFAVGNSHQKAWSTAPAVAALATTLH